MTKFNAKYYGAARQGGEDHDAVITCLLRGYEQKKTGLTVDGSSQIFRRKDDMCRIGWKLTVKL